MLRLTSLNQNLSKHLLTGVAGSLIIIAFLFYAVSSPGQDVAPVRVLTAIRESSITLFLAYIVTGLIGIFFRARRYRVLIRAAGEPDSHIPTMKKMVLVTAVRGMVVDFLPARLGELIYVALLKKVANTSIPSGLSSLLFAMLLDVVVLAPVTILLGVLIGYPNKTPIIIALISLIIVACFYIGVRYILPWILSLLTRSRLSSTGLFQKLLKLFSHLNDAIQSTIRAGVFLEVFTITIVVRFLKYLGLLILFHSVAGASFPALELLSNIQVLGAMIASEMTAALPIPTLMSFGAWEVGGMTFMAVFGAPPQESLLTLLAIHILTQSVDYGIGLSALYLLFSNIDHSRSSQKRTVPWLAGVFTLLALVCATVSWKWYKSQADKAETTVTSTRSTIIDKPNWMHNLNGFITWSSNRMGNHNIMLMDLSNLSIRPLTIHPNTETHPRISPDGTRVAFARSEQEWQSWRDQQPWNVWVLDIESGKQKLIARTATAPTWSEDGRRLYFQRSIGEVWSHDFKSGKQTRLYQRNTDGLPNAELQWPSINQQGQLAVSYRDFGRPTNIVADGHGGVTVVSLGCMITWSPSGDFAMFVSSKEGGKQSNQFNRYDPKTGKISKWLDLPGELSHEYFPRLDRSQQYLVFAASDGGHEPDIADYEIHLWKTSTPASEAQRLTFDPGNDSWPDVYIR